MSSPDRLDLATLAWFAWLARVDELVAQLQSAHAAPALGTDGRRRELDLELSYAEAWVEWWLWLARGVARPRPARLA